MVSTSCKSISLTCIYFQITVEVVVVGKTAGPVTLTLSADYTDVNAAVTTESETLALSVGSGDVPVVNVNAVRKNQHSAVKRFFRF